MSTIQKKTRSLLQQAPDNRISNKYKKFLTLPGAKSHSEYQAVSRFGRPFRVALSGRPKWALEQLLEAGAKGCTPIENPAPRWSVYIHRLRELGLEIDTLKEPHSGTFPGHHGRYVLRSLVIPLSEKGGHA